MIENWFHQALHYVSMHPNVGIFFAFIISFAESLPLLGTVIPGSVTMTAIGTLIGAQALPAFSTLMWASIGAFCGDTIGYYLGKYYDDFIRNMWPFSKYPQWIKKGEEYFHQHGGKSIIIGRFVGPVRSTIPLIAGLLKLNTFRFMFAAIPSAICWALAYTVPGILLGALSLDLQPQVASRFILFGLIGIVLCWLIFWLCFQVSRAIGRRLNTGIHHLWQSMALKQNRLYRFLKRERYPNDHHQLTLFGCAITSFILFIVIFICVLTHNSLLGLNKPLFYFLQSLHNNWLDQLFTLFTLLGDKPVMFGFAFLMILWLGSQGHYRAAKYYFAITILIAACIGFVKFIFHSPRPTGIYYVAQSSSFPSGHTALAVVILGFAAYLGTLLASRTWRKILYTIATTLIILVALSRLYLGAHWFTDILGSATLGLAVLLGGIAIYRRHLYTTSPTKPWLTAIALALFIPWVTYGSWQFTRTLQDYKVVNIITTTTLKQWWLHPHAYLDLYRNNRFGQAALPFNVQWAGNFSHIQHALLKNGWHIIKNPTSIGYNLNRLNTSGPSHHLPLLPLLYFGHPPQATFYKPTANNNEIIEITFWLAPIKFIDKGMPVWMGCLDYHQSVAYKVLQLRKQIARLIPNDEIKQLIPSLKHGYRYRIDTISPDNMPPTIQRLKWNGKVIIIRPK